MSGVAVEMEKRRQRQEMVRSQSCQGLENWWMGQDEGEGGIQRISRVFAWAIRWMKSLTEMHCRFIVGSTFLILDMWNIWCLQDICLKNLEKAFSKFKRGYW